MSVKRILDKAIKMCDSAKLVKTIGSKKGYGLHIIESGHGQRIVLTFPGETINNPHMYLGAVNSSNLSKAKETFESFTK